ncbi:DUF397 domain-containing protein [Actinomadura rupiterrae]|uniref:DUF397 domain-containing protein n=1 Tax=Actinomadura rupiterrae TaxID=559627 RepID=UPI0020A54403|nr:DUF397 domain-containing protein [Actinomadura rupiterrae]MCP2343634.1 hypothetical protein [Actinomadura rupiterrae]
MNTRTTWRKSSHSGGSGGDCVEIADLTHQVAIRDSKSPHTPHLPLTPTAFTTLIQTLKSPHQ